MRCVVIRSLLISTAVTGTHATGCDRAAAGSRLASAADPPSARFGARAVTRHRRGAAREDHLGGRLRLGRHRAPLARHSEHALFDGLHLEADYRDWVDDARAARQRRPGASRQRLPRSRKDHGARWRRAGGDRRAGDESHRRPATPLSLLLRGRQRGAAEHGRGDRPLRNRRVSARPCVQLRQSRLRHRRADDRPHERRAIRDVHAPRRVSAVRHAADGDRHGAPLDRCRHPLRRQPEGGSIL